MVLKTKEERAAYARKWRAEHPEAAKAHDIKKRSKPGASTAATERVRQWRERQKAEHPEEFREKQREQNKAWLDANREKRREYEKRRRVEKLDEIRAYNAKWHRENRANNPDKIRRMHLKSLYGVTPEDYERMLKEQGGRCLICPATPDGERHGVFHIDHCHTGGHVRGLLCHRCNTALGLFADDPERLRKAIGYLKP
jgi:hypothetical protein